MDRLQKLSRVTHGLGAVTTTLIVFLSVQFVHRPLEIERDAVTHQQANLRRLTATKNSVQRRHDTYKSRRDALNRRSLQIEQRLPSVHQEAEFLKQLTAIASRTGTEVRDFRPGQTEKFEHHRKMTVQISASGTYEALCRFLDGLGQEARLSQLMQIDLQSVSQSADECELRLTLKVYYRSA